METASYSFGTNLRQLIDARGLTYGVAAEKIGISLSFLNQLMRGESHPSLPMIYQIGEKLGLSVSELFQDKEQEKREQTKSDLILKIIGALPALEQGQLDQVLRLIETHARGIAETGPLVGDEFRQKSKRLK